MPKAARVITRDDLIAMDIFAKERKERRAALLPSKKLRRVEVGPHVTFYFENYDTMWLQIHEMLHIEKGGEEQIDDELRAYNPLIPQGTELVATMMIEVDDPIRRANVLRRLGHIEEHIAFEIGDLKVKAVAEGDAERTTADGKTSAVHFIRFPFSAEAIAKFKDPAVTVMLGIAHENYAHLAVLSPASRNELAGDFTA
ncbi:MAG: DUF3501 family protein [Alphaproteobacteria bacterium]|nr:DUF3501 family protein [Alphaproteobacteria bacterium]